MFVSSYNTYVNTNPSDKTSKERQTEKRDESTFTSKLLEQQDTELTYTKHLPVDYISKSKAYGNKLTLQIQEKELENPKEESLVKPKELTKEFMSSKTLQNAQTAYQDNSKIFSFFRKPQVTLDQTAKIDKTLPSNIQELKEKNIRHIMVNTYIQNDRYYQITA